MENAINLFEGQQTNSLLLSQTINIFLRHPNNPLFTNTCGVANLILKQRQICKTTKINIFQS